MSSFVLIFLLVTMGIAQNCKTKFLYLEYLEKLHGILGMSGNLHSELFLEIMYSIFTIVHAYGVTTTIRNFTYWNSSFFVRVATSNYTILNHHLIFSHNIFVWGPARILNIIRNFREIVKFWYEYESPLHISLTGI